MTSNPTPRDKNSARCSADNQRSDWQCPMMTSSGERGQIGSQSTSDSSLGSRAPTAIAPSGCSRTACVKVSSLSSFDVVPANWMVMASSVYARMTSPGVEFAINLIGSIPYAMCVTSCSSCLICGANCPKPCSVTSGSRRRSLRCNGESHVPNRVARRGGSASCRRLSNPS